MDLTYFEMLKLPCDHENKVLVIMPSNKAHYRCTHCFAVTPDFDVPPPGDWLR